MIATTPTSTIRFSTSKSLANGTRIKVDIRLDDDCKNGHETFSITGEYGTSRDFARGNQSGGCIHEEILKHFPQFAGLVALHLSDQDGVPMYAVENGFHHYQENNGHLQGHLRATDAQLAEIKDRAPRTKEEFSWILEDLGFRAQWKAEALAAVAQLEELTGGHFQSRATRPGWVRLALETVDALKARRASGYYEPEAIAARDAQAKADAKAARIKALRDDHAAKVKEVEEKLQVALYFVERDLDDSNVIYYSHSRSIGFNWHGAGMARYIKNWTREEFDQFVATVDRSALPAGIGFGFKTV